MTIGMRSAVLGLLILASPAAAATGWIDLESGLAGSGYNDVQIPRQGGTRFSLVDDLSTESGAFWRLRATASLGAGRRLELLAAPLSLAAKGPAPVDLRFGGVDFPAGTPLEAGYRFDSYRISYLQTLREGARLRLELGFTAKLRDAEIAVEGGGRRSVKENRGFVPLLALRLQWRWRDPWILLLEADALAAPQGRAEDLLLALARELAPGLSLRAGYRLVEGGADVEEVYNFALIHYAAAGLRYEF